MAQYTTFKKIERDQSKMADAAPPPCECKARVQRVGPQLRCSQCGIQWWPHEPQAPVVATRDGFKQGSDSREYESKELRRGRT